MTTQASPIEVKTNEVVLSMAMELSHSKWKLGFSACGGRREVTIAARDLPALWEAIAAAKRKLKVPKATRVISCYEAGRDGFWLHRVLAAGGVENLVVDSSSIEVARRQRRAKTDRIDVWKLERLLRRYLEGEGEAFKVVRVPSEAAEDGRRLMRELGRLKKERSGHLARMRSLLALCGVVTERIGGRQWLERVTSFRGPDGRSVPARLQAELVREARRLELVKEQIAAIAVERQELEARAAADAGGVGKIVKMQTLRSIGAETAWTVGQELFCWRTFANRREVGAVAGLTGVPFASGERSHDQGIAKSGNRRVRAAIVEMSWLWLRYQPDSALTRWFKERFGHGPSRQRRVGIVALARRLLIALWRYVEFGEVPAGAKLKAAGGRRGG